MKKKSVLTDSEERNICKTALRYPYPVHAATELTESQVLANYKKILSQKIEEKLYELRGMDSEYREGQRSVFLWVQRELRRT